VAQIRCHKSSLCGFTRCIHTSRLSAPHFSANPVRQSLSHNAEGFAKRQRHGWHKYGAIKVRSAPSHATSAPSSSFCPTFFCLPTTHPFRPHFSAHHFSAKNLSASLKAALLQPDFVQAKVMSQLMQIRGPDFIPVNLLIPVGKIPQILQEQQNLWRHICTCRLLVSETVAHKKTEQIRIVSVSDQLIVRAWLENNRQQSSPTSK